MRLELLLRGIGSLKEKRHVVRSVVAHLDKALRVGVAEVDHHDKWQRCALGIAAVSPQRGQLERILHTARKTVESRAGVEILGYTVSPLEEME